MYETAAYFGDWKQKKQNKTREFIKVKCRWAAR
jgi:hypothetical protein